LSLRLRSPAARRWKSKRGQVLSSTRTICLQQGSSSSWSTPLLTPRTRSAEADQQIHSPTPITHHGTRQGRSGWLNGVSAAVRWATGDPAGRRPTRTDANICRLPPISGLRIIASCPRSGHTYGTRDQTWGIFPSAMDGCPARAAPSFVAGSVGRTVLGVDKDKGVPSARAAASVSSRRLLNASTVTDYSA